MTDALITFQSHVFGSIATPNSEPGDHYVDEEEISVGAMIYFVTV